MTIQSRSPFTSADNFAGSVLRWLETFDSDSPIVLKPRAWPGRLLFLDDAANLVIGRRREPLTVERRRPGQQLVKEHAQAVDIAANIHVKRVEFSLLRAHVERSADHLREPGVDGLISQLLADRLGDAEVDHLDHRDAVVRGDQDVRRLQVAVDDALAVGMLDRLADGQKQIQPLAGRELLLVAVINDRGCL